MARIGIGAEVAVMVSTMVIVATATVGITTYWRYHQALVQSELDELSSLAASLGARFVADISSLRDDAVHLSGIPPLKGIVRARQSGGVDPKDGSTEQMWKERLGVIFMQLLRAKSKYVEARFIGVMDGGRELFRVDRGGPEGSIQVVSPHLLKRQGDRDFFQQTIRLSPGQVYLSEIERNREHGQDGVPHVPVIRAAVPIVTDSGEQFGIVVIGRQVTPKFGESSSALIDNRRLSSASDRADYRLHPDADLCFAFEFGGRSHGERNFPSLEVFQDDPSINQIATVEDLADGRRRAVGAHRTRFDPDKPDRFVEFLVSVPYEEVVADANRIRDVTLWASGILVALSLIPGVLMSRALTRPLTQIARAADEFGRGKADVELPTARSDEVGVVARSLQDMMEKVRSTQIALAARAVELDTSRKAAVNLLHDIDSAREELEESERVAREHGGQLQAILDNAVDAIITIDADGRVISFNASAEKAFGYTADEVVGQSVNMLIPAPHRDRHDQYIQNYLATDRAKIIGTLREVEAQRKDGAVFPIELAVSEVRFDGRRMFTGMAHDLTRRRRQEREIEQATEELAARAKQIERANRELKQSNEELQQFAYVASHDLQEPLRKVTAFCQMLAEEYGPQLDDNARVYIDFAVDGAQRMKQLVADLLDYSRVDTQGRPLAPTDAYAACWEAIDDLEMAVVESAAEITCDRLPEVLADRAQLVRLFQNLIGNAIKYRGSDPPKIHIYAEDDGEQWLFHVRDNGIGIAPEYREKVFIIFQRLHGRGEYSGTGIGLAICRRIVERFDGTIWVDSDPGRGSDFCFTLPRLRDTPGEGEHHEQYSATHVGTQAG